MADPLHSSARTVFVAGASGLVGREIMQGLLADTSVAAVHSLARRELPLQHPKLTQHIVDFKALPALPRVHEAFIAMGTTIKVAGSQAAFRAVDFDAVVAVAKAARAAGAARLGVVSAMGANPGHQPSPSNRAVNDSNTTATDNTTSSPKKIRFLIVPE